MKADIMFLYRIKRQANAAPFSKCRNLGLPNVCLPPHVCTVQLSQHEANMAWHVPSQRARVVEHVWLSGLGFRYLSTIVDILNKVSFCFFYLKIRSWTCMPHIRWCCFISGVKICAISFSILNKLLMVKTWTNVGEHEMKNKAKPGTKNLKYQKFMFYSQ